MDFSTMSKGTSAGGKSRGTLKQALFSQGVSDKNGTFEVGLIIIIIFFLNWFIVGCID